MNDGLIKRHNATVGKDDICWFLGDVGMCKTSLLEPIIKQMNGRKFLILGNHDSGVNAMYNCGFDSVVYSVKLMIANEVVTLSHCPLLDIKREDVTGFKNEEENWHGETRGKNKKFCLKNDGQFHLHGHLHSPNGGRSEVQLNRQWDVGLDGNNLTPISQSTIERWIHRVKMVEHKKN